MRDHGGDLGRAKRRYGDGDWIDLSTGINPRAYPVGEVPAPFWERLPDAENVAALEGSARAAYAAGSDCKVVAVGGAQAAIQIVPRLAPPGRARVLAPTYNEHAAALREAGWTVEDVSAPDALAGADLAVAVNPNNPDGRQHAPADLLALRGRVGRLVVDESFADPEPALSLAPHLGPETADVLLMRSFGKFYGLAGLRLGFALAGEALAARIAAMAGPWPVPGPAVAVGLKALADRDWQERTAARLVRDAARLDGITARAGWELVGGTPLFRTFAAHDAIAAQERLAAARIWTRAFPYSRRWLRLGLPGAEADWRRLEDALR